MQIKTTPLEILANLSIEQLDLAKQFVDLGIRLNCSVNVKHYPKDKTWKCKFTTKKPKKNLLCTLWITDSHEWLVQLRLFNIHTFIELVQTRSENVKNIIKSHGGSCTGCNNDCGRVDDFCLDNVTYNKCCMCNYVFKNLSASDWVSVLEIMEVEHRMITSEVAKP